MLIYLAEQALLSGVPPDLMQAIQKHLTITNPLLQMKEHLGLSLFGIVPSLSYYTTTTKTGVKVPIGAVPRIIELASEYGVKIADSDIADHRTHNVQTKYFCNLNFTGKLRPYQQGIVDACRSRTVGVVEAMTGSGKTITFVALTLEKKEATIILVNTIELANQTRDAFLKFTNVKEADLGFIGAGKFELKPITVALHQTMAKLDRSLFEMLSKTFGMVIADEVNYRLTMYTSYCTLSYYE